MAARTPPATVTVQAPAKLNLFLELTARRPDGYHQLTTVMARTSLADTLQFSVATEDQPDCTLQATFQFPVAAEQRAEFVGTQNLICRAAAVWRRETGVSAPVQIAVQKRVPWQAGLGGGSADAAATLRGLDELFDTQLSPRKLAELAAELGSDVPFFLGPHPFARCEGRGEQIFPLPGCPPLHAVILVPPCGLSTAEVYRHCQLAVAPRPVTELVAAIQAGQIARLGGLLFNGLQGAAARVDGDVLPRLERLRRAGGAGTLLTGSGSAMFSLTRNAGENFQLAYRLRAAQLGQVFPVRVGI